MAQLIKIGTAPSNNIVLVGQYVSARHAEITVLDSGEIYIEDKGSTNGTFVGPNKTRLTPGTEVQIQRGDLVLFGNEPLNWAQIPKPFNSDGHYKRIITIGSNFRNDIQVRSSTVSRYHANVLVDKSGKVFIMDNGSTNGTEVNGTRIKPHQPTRIKKGDLIEVGGENISSRLQTLMPPVFPRNIWPTVAACVIGVGCIVGLVIFLLSILGHQPRNPKDAVVLVAHQYHYKITPKENPYNLPLETELTNFKVTTEGTAFFIDENGRLGTCLHVVEPWRTEYDQEKMSGVIEDAWREYLRSELPRQVQSWDELGRLFQSDTEVARVIRSEFGNSDNSLEKINDMLNTVFTSGYKVTGVTDDIFIGYPGHMYNKIEQMQPASVVAKSANPDIDVAILQLNTKKTPEDRDFFPVENMLTQTPKNMREKFQYIGFPSGSGRSIDEITKEMQPFDRESKIAKVPSKYQFEIQDQTASGASGSPIFNENHQLAGILSAGTQGIGAPTSFAIHAKYLKKLYEEEFPAKN